MNMYSLILHHGLYRSQDGFWYKANKTLENGTAPVYINFFKHINYVTSLLGKMCIIYDLTTG